MSEFEINVLPFSILLEKIKISFSTNEKEGYDRIYVGNLPKNIPVKFKDSLGKHAWWSINQQEDDATISVNLFENKPFAKEYFNKILFNHFHAQNIITNRNFIKDTEVYLEESFPNNTEIKKYNGYSLRVDTNYFVEGTSLLVSYEGDTFILTKSVRAAKLDNSHLGKVMYKGRITKFKRLSEDEQKDTDNIYPILNRDIKKALKIDPGRNYSENKYKKYYEFIHKFYTSQLKGVVIGDCIKVFESGFCKPYEEKIKQTSDDSNLLLFGNNKKNFIPYIGIKEHGPIEGLFSHEPIKFIFIFHEDDKEFANKVYSYLRKGYKSFPGLESFVKIKFNIDTDKSIKFTERNPIAEIESALLQTKFDTNSTYAALYISQIKKDSDDEEDDGIYYRLKELLLNHGIVSQVIFKDNINNPSFNYFLPNIAIALLAKLGGVPWRLYRPIKNDLVIGIGADRSLTAKDRYIGNAFCFKNDGSFRGFNAFEKNDTISLAISLRGTIEEYIKENSGCDRLVIHYYKKMSQKEEKPIHEVLNRLNLSLPCVIVTVNNTVSDDYILFDTTFDGKMPQSGSFIQTKQGEFLLCNNTRYSNNTATRIESFPLPIKIKIQSSNYEKINDTNVVRELIDQVYQFSRMYWKSVRQRNLPVTIEYSELVARMVSHFENKELPQLARNSLWFL